MNGQPVKGSKYAAITGKDSVPDARGLFCDAKKMKKEKALLARRFSKLSTEQKI